MIEDTSFLIDLLRGDHEAVEALERLEANRVPEKISAISVLELQEGLIRSEQSRSKRERVQQVLTSKHIIPADQQIMIRAGKISGQLYNDGIPIDREDCIIAATAIFEDEPVITRNVKHFQRIEHLNIERY